MTPEYISPDMSVLSFGLGIGIICTSSTNTELFPSLEDLGSGTDD